MKRLAVAALAVLSVPAFATPDTVRYGPRNYVGYLWKPEGRGPFPAMVWNHGSEEKVDPRAPLARFFLSRGYVFFMPVRRGHKPNTDHQNYFEVIRSKADDKARATLQALVAEREDVHAGYNFVARLPAVNPHRIVLGGCSFGGIETVLATETIPARAFIDWAGASESWAGSAPLRARLIDAIAKGRGPIFFLQASNDYDTTPTKVLSFEMGKHNRYFKAEIFPPLGSGQRGAAGHGPFCSSPEAWGAEVAAWLETHNAHK